jgi:hypothetical protein
VQGPQRGGGDSVKDVAVDFSHWLDGSAARTESAGLSVAVDTVLAWLWWLAGCRC